MKRNYWIGLITLIIIYSLIYIFFYEAPYAQKIPRLIRHLIKFIILIIVYLIGSFFLDLNKIKWMKVIWHFIHISGIVLIITLGSFIWIIRPSSNFFISLTISVNEFLISPVLYVGMGILYKKLLITKN